MQSEPSLVQTSPTPKKFNFLIIVVVILVLALAGVGYWGYQQSSALKANQSALAALQGKYDSLTTQKNSLSAELDTTKAELEKTKGELATTQVDLGKAQGDVKSLQENADKAAKWMDVAIAFIVDNQNKDSITPKVDALGDSKLSSLWKEYKDVKVKTFDDLTAALAKINAFERYLLEGIANLLK